MIIHKGRNMLVSAIILLLIAGTLIYFYFDDQNSPFGKQAFLAATKEIENRGINDGLKASFPKLGNFNKLDVDQLKDITSNIIKEDELDQVSMRNMLEVIDQALTSTDTKKVRHGLKLLYKLYPYIQDYKKLVSEDLPRKTVIIGHLYSQDNVIRKKAFGVLSFYFIDADYVIPSLLDVAANTGADNRLEKLHQFRTLGGILNEERTEVRDFLIEKVLLTKDSPNNKAVSVETVYFLSRLDPPPEEIILPTIEMLEDVYFGDTLLLDAIENYGNFVKPYLERLKALQLEVDERIMHGRDNNGRGSSTFTKARYQSVIKKIEKL